MRAIENCSKGSHKTPSIVLIASYVANALILLFGLAGNSIVIYIMGGINSRSLHDHYLRHLLIFNALACVFDLLKTAENFRYVFKRAFSISKDWAIYINRYNWALFWTFTQASGLTLCMLLLDRYISIHWPMKYRSYQGKKRLLKILPYVFLISSSLFSFGGDFWYSITECHEPSINRSVFYRDVPSPLSRNTRRVIVDILNEILFSVMPASIMLYLAIRITLSLARFLKRKRAVFPRPGCGNDEREKIKDTYSLSRLSILSKSKFNSIDLNTNSHIHVNIHKISNSKRMTPSGYSNNEGGKPTMNISSIFFVLFFVCYMPTSITTFLRHYLVFRNIDVIQQTYRNDFANNKIIMNPVDTKKMRGNRSYYECGIYYANHILSNSSATIGSNTSSLPYDRNNCGSSMYLNPEEALDSLYRVEEYLEILDSIYISFIFCVTLITDQRILAKYNQYVRALLHKIKNIF
ncbi:unnamed protein product [Gordionus sp. m RMFG-2023]